MFRLNPCAKPFVSQNTPSYPLKKQCSKETLHIPVNVRLCEIIPQITIPKQHEECGIHLLNPQYDQIVEYTVNGFEFGVIGVN